MGVQCIDLQRGAGEQLPGAGSWRLRVALREEGLRENDVRVIGAAHAGWRGLAQGVLEQTLTQLLGVLAAATAVRATAAAAPDILAWLGPCIGPSAFEVGGEVRDAFLDHDPRAAQCFVAHGATKWLADLQGLARQRLQALGIRDVHGNDGSPPWCTVGNPSRFFSHRRDSVTLGGSGRMAADATGLSEVPFGVKALLDAARWGSYT
jgi:copper oxidase (laccase) domain-containing protein